MGVTFNQLAAVRAYSSCSQAVRQTQWRPTTLLALSWSRPDRAKQNVASFWTTRRATATCVRPSVRLSSCPSVDRRLAAFIIPLYNICLAMNLIDVHSWPCGQLHCQTLAMQSPGAGREQRESERECGESGRAESDSESVRNFNQFDFIERRWGNKRCWPGICGCRTE